MGIPPKALPPLYHINAVVKDVDSTIEFLSALFGISPWQKDDYHLKPENVTVGGACGLTLAGAKLGSTFIELIQPLEGDSAWADALKHKGEGLHHIAFSVLDWPEKVSQIQKHGGRMIAGGAGVGMRWGYFYTTPGGMIVEFEEKLPGQDSMISIPETAGDKRVQLERVSMVVEDREKTSRFLSAALGIDPWQTNELSVAENRLKTASASLDPITLELIQPVSGRSFWSQFIESKGEGISHLTLSVSNWQEITKTIEENGGRMVVGGTQDGKRWGYFYTTPGGIVFNLREKPDTGNH